MSNISFLYFLGDANGLDEPEFFRKLQPSLHYNAQNSNLEIDSMKKKFFQFFKNFFYLNSYSYTERTKYESTNWG